MSLTHRPIVLIVLDGWGYSDEVEYNAIRQARTPVWDHLWATRPHTLIRGSGAEVGLPAGQMGNSEVGHLNLGAGRVVYQEFTRINNAIRSGSFFDNHTLQEAIDGAVAGGGAVHLMGLLSPGGVHSHQEHIHAMADLAIRRGAEKIHIHAFLDGRDTPPQSAAASIAATEARLAELGHGSIASLVGRFFAMDRDKRWDRIQLAYDMLTQGEAPFTAPDAGTALEQAYARGETDEFVQPTLVVPPGAEPVRIRDGDAVIFMNYRADRARQLTRAFIEDGFDSFERPVVPRLSSFVSLTEYNEDFDIPVAYPPERLKNVIGEYVARLGLHQLRIAETEKYAHVTFFFNGGLEPPFPGEDRILVPSPKVKTYDMQPEMSARELTDKLVEAIGSGRYDLVICNYANPDMVGHTGKLDAAMCAVETIDACLGRVVEALDAVGGEVIVTADHGNVECMRDEENDQPHTAHTSDPVPFLYVGQRTAAVAEGGILADVAPTLLYLMGLEKPSEMSGRSLLEFD